MKNKGYLSHQSSSFISECDTPYISLSISEHNLTMSSILNNDKDQLGPQKMLDNDATTIAHTIKNVYNCIKILLSTPQIISNIILMNRGDVFNGITLRRLNNTKVTLLNPEQEEFVCGYVRLQSITLAEVVMVGCNSLKFRSKQIIVSKSATQHGESLNIAELRLCSEMFRTAAVCYLPKLSTYESSIYFTEIIVIPDKSILVQYVSIKL